LGRPVQPGPGPGYRARLPRRDPAQGLGQGRALLLHVRTEVLLDEDHPGSPRVRRRERPDRRAEGHRGGLRGTGRTLQGRGLGDLPAGLTAAVGVGHARESHAANAPVLVREHGPLLQKSMRRVDVAFYIHHGSARWMATPWIGEARSTLRVAPLQILRPDDTFELIMRNAQLGVAAGVGRDAVDVVLEQHAVLEQRDVGGLLKGPELDEFGVLVVFVLYQPALVRLAGGTPEIAFLPGDQHVFQAQFAILFAVVVDETATGHAVGAAGEEIARQLDHQQRTVLLAQLGLQVAAPAFSGVA